MGFANSTSKIGCGNINNDVEALFPYNNVDQLPRSLGCFTSLKSKM